MWYQAEWAWRKKIAVSEVVVLRCADALVVGFSNAERVGKTNIPPLATVGRNTSPVTRKPKHGGIRLTNDTLCVLPGTSEFGLAVPITLRSAPWTGTTLKKR